MLADGGLSQFQELYRAGENFPLSGSYKRLQLA